MDASSRLDTSTLHLALACFEIGVDATVLRSLYSEPNAAAHAS